MKTHEKSEKIFEKTIDTHGQVLYDKQALEKAQSAMMQEIARKRGNFYGVCPRIGRLKGPVHGVDRREWVKPACLHAGLFHVTE